MAEELFDKKFNFLFEEANRRFVNENKYFDDLDKLLENRFDIISTKIKTIIQSKCKDDLERLNLYTDYNKNDINNIKPIIGYEKEFNEAKLKLNNCTKESNVLIDEIYDKSRILTELTLLSQANCLNECKKNIKQLNQSDKEANNCINACIRYRKYNMHSYYKVLNETIDLVEKKLI